MRYVFLLLLPLCWQTVPAQNDNKSASPSSNQEGQLTDTDILIEYLASDHFSIGGGINRFSLDLQLVDHGRQWDWSSLHTGIHLYVGYTF